MNDNCYDYSFINKNIYNKIVKYRIENLNEDYYI